MLMLNFGEFLSQNKKNVCGVNYFCNMTAESIIGITSGVIAIGTFLWQTHRHLRKKSLEELMSKLADKNTPLKSQRGILKKMNAFLQISGCKISSNYINNFRAAGRSKLEIFYDICIKNKIEPTADICKKFVGSDEPKFRKEWTAKFSSGKASAQDNNNNEDNLISSNMNANNQEKRQVVYMSALLKSKFSDVCDRLTAILDKYNIEYCFLQGTKDIWCRDYMPVQTPSGKLIQFRYDPSYLKGNKEWEDSRSDVKVVNKVNGFSPVFSEINLDGGNVVMYRNKAIITDRVFSENPDLNRDYIRKKLAELLECEIIIIPALAKSYDYTGHADGMIRWVDENTVIGNDLSQDSQTFRNNMNRAMRLAKLNYIEFPYFDCHIEGNDGHAIGVYLNYLEVGNLIIMPAFEYPGNKDKEALDKLKQVFPNKTIETIDYNDVALCGGILNCTTWVINK